MRSHAAAIGGIADHHVVEPGIGNEAELAHELGCRTIVQVDALDQQRPLAGLARGQVVLGERSVFELPAVAKERHQT